MDFDLAITIRRPPAVVLAFFIDIQDRLDPSPSSPVPELEKVPAGPTTVGTRWREVVKLAPGVRMTVWSTVTAIEPGRLLAETFTSAWMHGTLEYTVSPTGNGTLLRQRETLTPKGPLRLFDRPIAAMLRPALVKRLEDVRDLLEAGAEEAAGAARTAMDAARVAIRLQRMNGIAPNANIYDVKVLGDDGFGTLSDVLEGIQLAGPAANSIIGDDTTRPANASTMSPRRLPWKKERRCIAFNENCRSVNSAASRSSTQCAHSRRQISRSGM